ncbi:MAG: protein phosphatase 2C domain-containing protein [Agarilytica sp.]
MSQHTPEIDFSAKTDKGRVRKHNEDSIYGNNDIGLWIVADGMGGYACGEVASGITVNTVSESVTNGQPIPHAITTAHDTVVARTETDEATKGMGSTIVALKIEEARYEVSWVGDSRCYLLRDQQLHQLSRDHSYFEWLLSQGLSQKDAANDPNQGRLTQGVGLHPPKPDTVSGELHAFDRFLLCSDGVYNEVSEAALLTTLSANTDSQHASQTILENALKNGGKDNISVVVVDIEPTKRQKLYIYHSIRYKLRKIAQKWRIWAPPLAGVALAGAIFIVFLSLR